MKNLFFTLLVLMTMSGFVFSQTASNTQAKALKMVKVSWDEIVAYDILHPSESMPKMKTPKPQFIPPTFPVDESEIIYRHPPQEIPLPEIREVSPPPDDDFAGLGDDGTSIPPDTKGVVGPNHLMIVLNTQVRMQAKDGTILSTVNLSSFWSSLGGTNHTYDPKLQYDPNENRWIFICLNGSSPTASELLVGVTVTDDPTGEWYQWKFDTDLNNNHWFDFPSIGFNEQWIVASGNMFTSSNQFGYVAVFVFDKEQMYNGEFEIDYDRLTTNSAFTLAPATCYDPGQEVMYLINNVSGGSKAIRKFILETGILGHPQLTNQGLIIATLPWADYYPYNNGNISPQQGSNQRIDAGDSRMRSAIFKNGTIWFTQTIFLPSGSNPSRCAAQWWQIETDGTIKQVGRVDDATGTMFYSYPSIAVNGAEDVLVGYSAFSSSQYASGAYSYRAADDPANTLRDPYQFKDGLGVYYKTYGGTRNRWGDYSATTVDPGNDLDFYSLQEYAGTGNMWQTWWARINMYSAPEPGFSANITIVPVGSGANFTDESQFVPTEWEWEFEGGTPATSTEQNPENIVYNTAGTYDVTLTVTNETGSNTIVKADYIEASTTILPEVDFTTEETLVCIGDTVRLEDLTIYNPISWLWEIAPSTFGYVNNTDETSQYPEIVFEESAHYSVTLTATNLNGSSSETKNDYIMAGGVAMPFEEDFEQGSLTANGWTVVNPDFGITWSIADVAGNTPGNQAAYVNIFDYSVLRERDQLISPPIDISGSDIIALTFEHAYAQTNPAITDSLIVFVSGDCQATWTRVMEFGEDGTGNFITHAPMPDDEFVPETEADWCFGPANTNCVYIDLSPWAGSTDFRVKFESYTFFGNNLYVDNVAVYSAVSIDDPITEMGILKVHPNPSTGVVNVYVETGIENLDLRIMNLQGQVVYQAKGLTGNTSFQINLSDQPKGMYVIEVSGENYIKSEKLILR